jgi:hypothetical protein
MSEHEEMTPETLRELAAGYRMDAAMSYEKASADRDRTTADILDGLAVLWELKWDLRRPLGGDSWYALGDDLAVPYPTPVAALVALGREARTQEAPDASA